MDTTTEKKETIKQKKARERQEACQALREVLKPGQTVYTGLPHVSRSGMMRKITVHCGEGNEIHNISRLVSIAADYSFDQKYWALTVGGCGMDMGFSVVYNLGRYLWPNGTPEPHGTRNGEPDNDGGYALKHRWL